MASVERRRTRSAAAEERASPRTRAASLRERGTEVRRVTRSAAAWNAAARAPAVETAKKNVDAAGGGAVVVDELHTPSSSSRSGAGLSETPKTLSGTDVIKKCSTVDQVDYFIDGPVKELPDGWIKEYRFRKIKSTKHNMDKDAFYIDPKSGYAFRSMKDAFRYIDTGNIFGCAMKPQKRSLANLHIIEVPYVPVRKRSIQPDNTAPADKNEGASAANTLCTAKGIECSALGNPTPNCSLGSLKHALDGADQSDGIRSFPANADGVQSSKHATKDGHTMSAKTQEVDKVLEQTPDLNEGGLHQFAGAKHGRSPSPSMNGINTVAEDVKPRCKRSRNEAKQSATPARVSSRLAALRVSQAAETAPGDLKGDVPNHLEKREVECPKQGAESCLKMETRHEAPDAVSQQNHGKQNGNEENGPSPNPMEQSIPGILDKSGLSLSSLFGPSWSDPCIEFAFKTLTSDFPLLDDTSSVADYFRVQPDANNKTAPSPAATKLCDKP